MTPKIHLQLRDAKAQDGAGILTYSLQGTDKHMLNTCRKNLERLLDPKGMRVSMEEEKLLLHVQFSFPTEVLHVRDAVLNAVKKNNDLAETEEREAQERQAAIDAIKAEQRQADERQTLEMRAKLGL